MPDYAYSRHAAAPFRHDIAAVRPDASSRHADFATRLCRYSALRHYYAALLTPAALMLILLPPREHAAADAAVTRCRRRLLHFRRVYACVESRAFISRYSSIAIFSRQSHAAFRRQVIFCAPDFQRY